MRRMLRRKGRALLLVLILLCSLLPVFSAALFYVQKTNGWQYFNSLFSEKSWSQTNKSEKQWT